MPCLIWPSEGGQKVREREKDIQRIRYGECGGKRGRRKRAAECFTLSNNSQSAIAQFNEFTFDDFR